MPGIEVLSVFINSIGAGATLGVFFLFWRVDRRLVVLETLLKVRDR